MYIINEVNLLQDLLKKNEKIQNQFQNGLAQIGKIRIQTRKMQNIVRNIFENKIKQIKKNTSLLQNTLANVKKERDYLKKN